MADNLTELQCQLEKELSLLKSKNRRRSRGHARRDPRRITDTGGNFIRHCYDGTGRHEIKTTNPRKRIKRSETESERNQSPEAIQSKLKLLSMYGCSTSC